MPESVLVEETSSGAPKAIRLKRRQVIINVEDVWRIDDEWWRSEPVSRMYFVILLDSGRRITLCHNLIDNHWYSQSY
jgi:hypothetical protein